MTDLKIKELKEQWIKEYEEKITRDKNKDAK